MKLYQQFAAIVFFILIVAGPMHNCYSQITPDDIPGLQLWLRADSLVDTTATGSKVTQWNNAIGGTLNVSQADPSMQPILVSSESSINNKPTIRFNGTSDYLDGGDILNLGTNSNTIYLIGKSNSTTGTYLAKAIAAASSGRWALLYWSPNFLFQYQDNSDISITIPKIPSGYELIKEINDRSLSNNYGFSNGVLLGTSGINQTFDMTTNFNFLVGAYNSTSGGLPPYGFYLDGDIAEIIIYDRILTATETANIEAYFSKKYFGPAVNLGQDINIPYGFCDTTLDASNRFQSYLWSTGAPTQTIAVDSTGTYSVTVTDVYGCSIVDDINVIFPSIKLHDTLFCAGSSITLSTGLDSTIGYTYLWSDLSTIDSILSVNVPGIYSVTVTDGSSCTAASQVITVSIDSFPLNASLGNDISICSGNSISLIQPVPLPPGLIYNWSTLSPDSFIVINQPIGIYNYSLTVTDLNGCSAIDDINVTIAGAAPSVDFTFTAACSGAATQFYNASFPNGTNWLWDFGDGTTSTQQNPVHTYQTPGLFTVSLKIFDHNYSYQ